MIASHRFQAPNSRPPRRADYKASIFEHDYHSVAPMRSVADRLRSRIASPLLALSVSERVALALALGARDLERFRLAHDPPLTPAEATRILERRRQRGRRPSRCIEDLIG